MGVCFCLSFSFPSSWGWLFNQISLALCSEDRNEIGHTSFFPRWKNGKILNLEGSERPPSSREGPEGTL